MRSGGESYAVRWRDRGTGRRMYRHLGYSPHWTRARAEAELATILHAVRPMPPVRGDVDLARCYQATRMLLAMLDRLADRGSSIERATALRAMGHLHDAEDDLVAGLRNADPALSGARRTIRP
jgi:hypothetical protein